MDEKTGRRVRIVCISDTHNHGPGQGYTLPKGDILIHAGDLTNQGSFDELKTAFEWLANTDYAAKVVVAGNHDLSLDSKYSLKHDTGWRVQADDTNTCRSLLESYASITYLQDSGTTVSLPDKDTSLAICGSPQSPDRGHQNWAFQYTADAAKDVWNTMSSSTDILITHTPPAGHRDASQHWHQGGCAALKETLWRVRPALHVCGHCHEGRGAEVVRWSEEVGVGETVWTWRDPGVASKKQSLLDFTGRREGWQLDVGNETAIVNASIMGSSFGRGPKVFNKPIVVDIELPSHQQDNHGDSNDG